MSGRPHWEFEVAICDLKQKGGTAASTFALTEYGMAMFFTVLRSKRAVQIRIETSPDDFESDERLERSACPERRKAKSKESD